MVWKRIETGVDRATPTDDQKLMRYFIYYVPDKTVRSVDIDDKISVEELLNLVKKEFGLNIQQRGAPERNLVLNFNGCDLKPKWNVADLSMPSGSMIRCLFRPENSPFMYVHCSYNKQILQITEPKLSLDSSIKELRIHIAKLLGIPLSLFCLETYTGKQRLYDDKTLNDYDIKAHEHLYLKVWSDQEKFLNSCLRGFSENFSNDEFIRHFQSQVALHIAAFHGHVDLAANALQNGGRPDRPVGEHPCRKWTNDVSIDKKSEDFKCPVHIAIQHTHIKILRLFVKNSIQCTQTPEPTTGFLPYRLALHYGFLAETKEKKQRYYQVYFYLYDKQFNLRIPLNSNPDHVAQLLTTGVANRSIRRTLSQFVTVSVPQYCRIMRWYERARERIWRKWNTTTTSLSSKRIYPEHGLLGYEVCVDGFNNNFEGPVVDQVRTARSNSIVPVEMNCRYGNFTEEEKRKIFKTKLYMKDFLLNDRTRARQSIAYHKRRSTVFSSQRMSVSSQGQPVKSSLKHPNNSSEHPTGLNDSNDTEHLLKQLRARFAALEATNDDQGLLGESQRSNKEKPRVSIVETPRRSVALPRQSIALPRQSIALPRQSFALPRPSFVGNSWESTEKDNMTSGNLQSSQNIALPSVETNSMPKLQRQSQVFFPRMSVVDAYFLTTTPLNTELAKRQSVINIEQIVSQAAEKAASEANHVPKPDDRSSDPQLLLEKESHLPLPDHRIKSGIRPIRSRADYQLHRSTMKVYEQHSETTTRATALRCLEEATFFKQKSWIKQVEISKEMVKNQTQRRIRRPNNDCRRVSSGPLKGTSSIISTNSNPIEVH